MTERRQAGVLLHLSSLPPAGDLLGSSLPGPAQPGTAQSQAAQPGPLGARARDFLDFLAAAGVSLWQSLPLCVPHPRFGSPYDALSAMAGNPALIDATEPSAVVLAQPQAMTPERQREFAAWCARNEDWLEPYAEFAVLRELHGQASWLDWPAPLRDRQPDAVAQALAPAAGQVHRLRLEQWVFSLQWQRLREYAAARGIALFGDLPIFVSLDSADVWGGRGMFQLAADGQPITVTGCPPDYFSAEGQLWGNPHYDWQAMAADGFSWWRRRIARQRELFDLVRIDHFRGFAAAWHIPARASSAREGWWVPGPGAEVLTALVQVAGPGRLVAEDLGFITPDVVQLRDEFSLPGMKILQFAFDGSPDNPYLPPFHGHNNVVYTGTHDNDTTLGWWRQLDEHTRHLVRTCLAEAGLTASPDGDTPSPEPGADGDMPWALIHLALASTARLAVIPAQDLLALGSDARMNTPGVAEGNWAWQAAAGAFTGELAARLRHLVTATNRESPHS